VASITRQKVGTYTYLYLSHSFRDPQGRPTNNKTAIGKIDPVSGKIIYKEAYLESMRKQGTPVVTEHTDAALDETVRHLVENALDSLKDIGLTWFFNTLGDRIGLTSALKETFPDTWMHLYTLACYLIASDKPLMYCDDWVEGNETMDVGALSSQDISDLLVSFGQKERNDFYGRWGCHIGSREYLALDMTSISSYSQLIDEVEWGYNRDGEALPQINLCLLLGEESGLPVYQTTYQGSLKDVGTFKTTMAEVSAVTGGKPVNLVMDKGFFSAKNVHTLLTTYHNGDFLLSVPFTTTFALRQIEAVRPEMNQIDRVIKTSGVPIRGIRRATVFGKGDEPVQAYIYYNPEKAVRDQNDLYGYIKYLKDWAQGVPSAHTVHTNKPSPAEIEKYIAVVNRGGKVKVRERKEVIAQTIQTCGWMVLISNRKMEAQRAHDIYRAKDVVEKGFEKYKNLLGLYRLRVHADERVRNKLLIAFIALILLSCIHRVMKEKNLYKKMTINRLLLQLSKLKTVTIKGTKILRPLTKVQKEIFSHFSIPMPFVG
jgi:hypothetical protein